MDGTYCRNASNETNLLGEYHPNVCFWIHVAVVCTHRIVRMKPPYIIGLTLFICVGLLILGEIEKMGRGRDIDMSVHLL